MVLKLEDTIGYNPLRMSDYERAVGPVESAIDIDLRRFPGLFRGYTCRLGSMLGLDYLVLDRPLEQPAAPVSAPQGRSAVRRRELLRLPPAQPRRPPRLPGGPGEGREQRRGDRRRADARFRHRPRGAGRRARRAGPQGAPGRLRQPRRLGRRPRGGIGDDHVLRRQRRDARGRRGRSRRSWSCTTSPIPAGPSQSTAGRRRCCAPTSCSAAWKCRPAPTP